MTDPFLLGRREAVRLLGRGAAAIMVGVPLLGGCRTAAVPRESADAPDASGWALVPSILSRITAPRFPDREFDITAFGARGDGTTDCTAAIARAIAACSQAGGGRVVVPPGRFATGPVHLRSNVDFHVAEGATVAFSQDPRAYLPPVFTRWEGMELMGYSPLIYALDEENVAVTGSGTLDGQADRTHWWPWKGNVEDGWVRGTPTQKPARDRLMADVEAGTPVSRRLYADGSNLRPQFIQPYRCRNVLIEGVRIINSPMWEVHPVLCTNVTVRGIRVETTGPNNDGCNPESCRDVLIEDCLFDTGDDCIAIKSGRNADGRRLNVPSENIVIRDCRMKEGHGGVTIGSEISGGVRNVFVERCMMDSPVLDRALRFKNNAARGGVLEHIYMRDVTIGQVADAVLSIDLHYEEGADGAFVPVVRDVEMRNVTSRKSNYGIYVRAIPGSVIEDIRLIDCRFDGVSRGNLAENVERLRLDGVTINGQPVTAAGIPRSRGAG